MTDVSTPPGRLHPRIQAVVTESGLLTPFFFKWLVALWERTGGFDDDVVDINRNAFVSNFLLNDSPAVQNLQQDIILQQPLPTPRQFVSRQTNANDTAAAYELISMTTAGTISLPPLPHNNDKVKLFNKNGSRITLAGNGNTIDGETEIVTVRQKTLLAVEYFTDIGEWIIV